MEVTDQLLRAKTALGDALGQIQDISHTGLDVDHISSSLARAVRTIFNVQSAGIEAPSSFERIKDAMESLRETLKLLQDYNDNSPALEKITSSVARVLALLFPVSKALENLDTGYNQEPLVLRSEVKKEEAEAHAMPLPRMSERPRRLSIPPASIRERRSEPRRFVEVDIGIHSNTNFFTGFSQDISSGGIFVATFDTLNIGEKLNVNFTLPQGPVLSLDGVVRWVRLYNDTAPDIEPGIGVQFENLAKIDKQAINQFLMKHPPMFYDD